MSVVPVLRQDISIVPQSDRVMLRPFIPSGEHRAAAIISRVLSLSDDRMAIELEIILNEFASRHHGMESRLLSNYDMVASQIARPRSLSRDRKLLLGALFSGEYSLESAALFNPSIVAHPNQMGVSEGSIRFMMSLRATGEGHISSIEFRTGLLDPEGTMTLDPVSRFVSTPEVDPDPGYNKASFMITLRTMGCENEHSVALLAELDDDFTKSELTRCVRRCRREHKPVPQDLGETLQRVQWIADSNYQIHFPPESSPGERAIFPISANESNGIEDARFVRFTEDDGSIMYYATYTAYNGHAILPQIIETRDFVSFRIRTLNGTSVRNKGMALFPRRIGGQYAMLSRQDDENLFIMYSEHRYHWDESRVLMRPAELWESVKIGNCGSPLETDAGWLVLTHGVGPMRKYCIGAALLDLDDPGKVLGRLKEPLVAPDEAGREGYVPNVVYSCGAMIHGKRLILPFAMSDRVTTAATVSLDDLLTALHG
ncbi:MAG TPA: glycoside hydrolase family 130 protein [bacterium]|nr:glycoside hydrolase family 130 protein [bacterium]